MLAARIRQAARFAVVGVGVVTLVSILACGVLLWLQSKRRVAGGSVETTKIRYSTMGDDLIVSKLGERLRALQFAPTSASARTCARSPSRASRSWCCC